MLIDAHHSIAFDMYDTECNVIFISWRQTVPEKIYNIIIEFEFYVSVTLFWFSEVREEIY